MDENKILSLLKQRLGISSNKRDEYLQAIIDGVVSELETVQGITIDQDNEAHVLFVIDYSDWRYNSRGEDGSMPMHIRWRLNNLYVQGE